MTREQELQKIEDAIKAGRLRRFKPWESSDWDEIPFKQRRSLIFNSIKKSSKMRIPGKKK